MKFDLVNIKKMFKYLLFEFFISNVWKLLLKHKWEHDDRDHLCENLNFFDWILNTNFKVQ